MKRLLLALGFASLAITLALVAGTRLAQGARPVVLGVIAGIAASLPTSLIIVWGVTRAQARPVARPSVAERPQQVFVVPPAPHAPEPAASPANPVARPAATALVHETRPAAIIGAVDEGGG
jgi:hypothetical protein